MKTLLALTLGLAALLSFSPPAAAAQQVGHVAARGAGAVQFGGVGHFSFRMAGKGTLVVEDIAEHAFQIHGQGTTLVTPDGHLVVTDFRGEVTVRGWLRPPSRSLPRRPGSYARGRTRSSRVQGPRQVQRERHARRLDEARHARAVVAGGASNQVASGGHDPSARFIVTGCRG